MIDPVRDRQLRELDAVTICTEILADARNELYMNMRFLDVALSSLTFQADPGCAGVGTDGYGIFYRPEYLMGLYRRGAGLCEPRLSAHGAPLPVLPPGYQGKAGGGLLEPGLRHRHGVHHRRHVPEMPSCSPVPLPPGDLHAPEKGSESDDGRRGCTGNCRRWS